MIKSVLQFILSFVLVITVSETAFSANEQFRSQSSGNWNSDSTWQMSTNGGITWFSATSTPRDSSGVITVRAPNIVSVTVSTTANQLIVDSNAVLAVNNGIILTILAGSGNDLTMSRGSTLNGSGSVRTQGIIEINLRAGSAFNAALNVNTGTTFAYDQSSPYDGSLFGNVTVDASATLNGGNISGRHLFIFGNVINNGIITASSTGGSYSINGSSLVNNGVITAAGTIYFENTTSVSGNGTFTPAGTVISGNVTLLNSITYSPSGYIVIDSGAVLNPNGNTFTLTSGTMTVNSNATVSASGTVRTQGTINLNLRAGSAFNAALNVNTGTTFAYDQSSPYDGSLFGNVTVDAAATLNGGNISGRHLFIFGNVINNGTITASSAGGSYSINGSSLVNNGVITTAGTVYFENTTSVSGNGTFTPAGTVISGNVTLLNSITYSPSSYIQINSGAVLNPNGNTFTLTSGTMTVMSNGTVSASGTVRTQGTVALNLRGGSAFNAALNVNTGLTYAYDQSSPYNGSIFGNIVIDAGATLNGGNISGRALFIYGSLINIGTLTASSTGGIIRLRGTSIINNGIINPAGALFFDTTTSLSGSGSFTSLTAFNTNANVTLNSTHQMHSISISAGAVFNISNRLLKLTASNPLIQNGTFTTTNSDIVYNNSQNVIQTISTININYVGLKIDNSAGTILSNNITIPDTLAVILGDLDLNGKIITFPLTGYLTETPGNTVKGTTGHITTTRSINAPSALNIAGFGAVLTTASNLGITEIRRGHTVQSGLNGGTSIKRYFDITPTNNSGLNANFKFKYDDSELNNKPEGLLKLFKSTNTGVTWALQGGISDVVNNEITINGLNSFSRWSADSSGASAVITLIIEGFYDPLLNKLNMRDTVRAYFRSVTPPFAIVDSSKTVIDSLTFTGAYRFPNAPSGTYYIQTQHRNSIETWSKAGVTYTVGNTLRYDFTTDSAKAFGNNMKRIQTKWTIYGGDVIQDGLVELADVALIDNDAGNFGSGYINTDITGDRFVDLDDLSIADNNSFNFVGVMRP
ncbi:MAG: hypothetical protein M3R36_04890 [Bacteroidota bacterium]|nr:hypothetical protein [Bacteroidota bacterium]